MARSAEEICEQAAERLGALFGTMPTTLIEEVVRGAERELRGQVSPAALGELLERLAAYRLAELVGSDDSG